MGKIVKFEEEIIDFDQIVTEIEFIVPKYLEALDALEREESVQRITNRIEKIETYWKRLNYLFCQVAPFEEHLPMKEIILQSLQAELEVLEKKYLPFHQAICNQNLKPINAALLEISQSILKRMDSVLKMMGFKSNQRDRVWIQEMLAKHQMQTQNYGIS